MLLSEKDISIVNTLVRHFYDVVPREYNTYCSLTARIVQSVLQHFSIDAKLVPCQIWLATGDHNYVIGFVGKRDPKKWDGHVVCRAKSMIVDAALKHFSHEFGLTVPSIISSHCFEVPTTVISRCDMSADAHFWWHYPPVSPEFDLTIPEEPRELVEKYAALVIKHLADPAIASELLLQGETSAEVAAGASSR
jgi:hypothetical protein